MTMVTFGCSGGGKQERQRHTCSLGRAFVRLLSELHPPPGIKGAPTRSYRRIVSGNELTCTGLPVYILKPEERTDRLHAVENRVRTYPN